MTREEILKEALKCVCGQREEDYGTPEDSFKVIGALWETFIKAKCASPDADIVIVPEDVAAMLALMKIARVATGHGKYDNWIDIAGHAACGGELQKNTQENMESVARNILENFEMGGNLNHE